MTSKIIVYIPVKNDIWFVEKAITSAVHWADHVFVFDESSSDGSHDIYKALLLKFKNLKIIFDRPKFDFKTSELRNYCLKYVRDSISGYNLIFELHADEIMSALVLNQPVREKLIDLPIGSSIFLPWINLWNKPFLFRQDKSVWSNNFGWFGFKDDRKSYFNGAAFHGSRVPENLHKNKTEIDLPVLHFQFLNLNMERSKQALYQIFERNHYPNKNIQQINKTYACAFDNRYINLIELDNFHYQAWLDYDIDLNKIYDNDDVNWRDYEVLKNFDLYGISRYKDLNIWYIDWELKREKIELENSNLTITNVLDPRDLETKISHWYLMKYQKYPFWKPDVWKLALLRAINFIINFYDKKTINYSRNSNL